MTTTDYTKTPTIGTARYYVLLAHCNHLDGLTDDELRKVVPIGVYDDNYRKRRNDLVLGGWLKDTGKLKPTKTGCQSIVWQATEKALKWFNQIETLKFHVIK